MPTAPTLELLDDLPVDADDALWPGLSALARQVADLMPALPVTSPILVSGDWGSGKTTMLRAVQRRLAARDAPVPAVWFDAWRYEGAGALLPALMRAVWEATPAEFREDEGAKKLFGSLFRGAAGLALRAAPTALGLMGVPLLPELLRGLSAGGVKGDVAALGGGGDSQPADDPTAALWRDFRALVLGAWGGAQPVVFIDDLDRCSPKGAVGLLDDVRMLVAGAADLHCKFVVAMDRSVLVAAIASKFTGISGYDGNRYLEKVFPVAFQLPAPQGRDVGELVKRFLAPTGSEAPNADHQDALSSALVDPMFANPRLMKRCINRFRMVVAFEAHGLTRAVRPLDAADEAARDRTLAKWIVATERWPDLRVVMVRHGEEYWRELEGALGGGRSPGAEADGLLAEEGLQPWLRREIFSGGAQRLTQYREADQRLRRWGL